MSTIARTKSAFSGYASRGMTLVSDLTLESLEDFRRTRNIASVTWNVELQTLRTFFSYCVKHKWIVFNPAKDLKAPRTLKPRRHCPARRFRHLLDGSSEGSIMGFAMKILISTSMRSSTTTSRKNSGKATSIDSAKILPDQR
jgi:site-specific recombinase XerC